MYKAYLIGLKSPNIPKHRHQEKLTSIINKKKIRYHLNKFLKDFNILPEKLTPLPIVKHVTKALFWATVYLTFSYLTITSSYEVIQQYRGNETKTNMKAIINKNVTYLPNMTICLKINTAELFKIESPAKFNYMSAWSRFFEETTLEGIFKVNNSKIYDDEIYLSLLKYLAMIYEAERAWEPGLTRISTFHSKKSDDWVALKKVLVPNIERYNITLDQLKSVFDGKFCSLPEGYPYKQLLAIFYQWETERECIAGSSISFIGMDTICFRLIGYKKYLRPLGTTELTTLYMYNDGYRQSWCQEVTIDIGSESRSTPRQATTQNKAYGHIYNRFPCEFKTEMDIGVKVLYRKLPYVNGDLQCSSDTSREECESKCLRGWIRANCHCSPITFNLTADISSYRNCTVDDYSICLEKYTENATYLCTNKSVPLCEQWHYEFGLAVYNVSFSNKVTIRPRIFDYVIIEQVFKCPSFEEFIGAFGGALGVWLGLDFVIIIEFIVKLATKLFEKILLRKVHSSEEDKQQKTVNIKHREENVENGASSSNEIGIRVVGHQKKFKENESEIVGKSIRQINESEKQRTSRKKRESNTVKEKHEQQRRKRSNHSKVDCAILNDEMKNSDGHNGSRRNHKVTITDNVDAVQDESITHANNSNARSWFLRKMLVLVLNDEAPANKRTVFLLLTEKLFWATIYLVGSVFTTLWCVELINLYLKDDAAYFPSLIINRIVSLPPPSLCIFYKNALYLERHGKISHALIHYFERSDIDRESFIQISDGKDWPELLVSIGLFYFSILAASENNYSDVSFISEYEWRLKLAAGRNTRLRNEIDKSVNDILLPKLLEWNITTNELRQKLGAELARMAELKISFTDSNGTIDIVNETSFYTAAITDEFFCYGLSYGVNFSNQDDVLEFSVNRTSYPQLFSDTETYIIFSDYLLEPTTAQFSIRLVTILPVFDSTYFRSGHGYVSRVLISVDSLHTSRPVANGVKLCSPNMTRTYCRAQCRIALIEKLCKCSPTYWTMMIQPTSGLDECTFDRYMECLNFNANEDLDCKDSCLPSCTAQYSQSYITEDDRSDSQEYKDTAVIRFSIKDGIYASIEEQQIFPFSSLLTTVKLNS